MDFSPVSRPVVGIATCAVMVRGFEHHATPSSYAHALLATAGALPVMLPPIGEAALGLLDRIDGIVLSGSPSNVAPELYGTDEDMTPDLHDPQRDATTLPLARAAIARGLPVLAICRGVQELNVALGGTLHQQVQAMAGRSDHRSEEGDMPYRFRLKQPVRLCGMLAELVGSADITVNSLHEQAIDRPGKGLAVEATAPDGTIEAVRLEGAGWAYGVQWHPEMHHVADPASAAIFRAFGEACRAYAATKVG